MFVAGFIAASILVGGLCFVLGRFDRADRRVTHEPADISEALKRSVR